MKNGREALLAYLRAYPGAVWKWEEDGRVLAWNDGTTIAFREEVNAIIECLAPRGLPSFDEVAIFLGACRGKFPAMPGSGPAAGATRSLLETMTLRNYQRALAELSKLAALPPALREPVRAKVFLAEAVFEGRIDLPAGGSLELLGSLATTFGDLELNTPLSDTKPLDQRVALWAVSESLRQHSGESLARRLRTGLEAVPVPIEGIVLPPDQRARRLLGELGQMAEHAGLAATARDLMAALRLPNILAENDELALGGSSGLGNRGPLDRLLLSELAHDDLTLATRIALNEAVYIQREPPALRPEHALVIVLDTGLRMWGIPRVIATSAALALTATHHSTGPVRTWRGATDRLEPADLLTKEGLDAHLAILRPDLDLREAISGGAPGFEAAAEDDVVLVTHRDALDDPEFRAATARVSGRRNFVLTIDHEGRTALHPLPWGNPRPLAEMQVDVEKLFPTQPAKTTSRPVLMDRRVADRLPAIFQEQPFPLRVSVTSAIDRAVSGPDGTVCLTNDGRLLQWTGNHQLGARQLAAGLPGGRTTWLRRDAAGRVIAVRGRSKDGQMSVIVLAPQADTPRITRFPGPQAPRAAFVDQHVLLVVLHTRVVAISLETGESLGETAVPPGLAWISGRYFSPGQGIQFAFWQGAAVQWDEAHSGRQYGLRDVALAFEREGVGAWLLLRDGTVVSPTGAHYLPGTGMAVARAEFHPDSNRLIATDRKGNHHLLDLLTKRVSPIKVAPESYERASLYPPTRPVLTRFEAIARGPGGRLALRKTKDAQWMEISANRDSLHLSAVPVTGWTDMDVRHFRRITVPATLGCELQEASWPKGSHAWMDARGMLHLRSFDPALPELTIVLCDHRLTVWSNDGRSGGDPFFTGQTDASAEFAIPLLAQHCANLC